MNFLDAVWTSGEYEVGDKVEVRLRDGEGVIIYP